jgi:hypothetical protein
MSEETKIPNTAKVGNSQICSASRKSANLRTKFFYRFADLQKIYSHRD